MSREALEQLLTSIEPVNAEERAKLTELEKSKAEVRGLEDAVRGLDFEKKYIDLRSDYEKLDSDRQDREERKVFARRIFWLLAFFIFATLLIIFLVGFDVLDLSDAVLITMLSTMSANVIGIFIYVVKYLFNRPNICSNCGLRISQNQTIKT